MIFINQIPKPHATILDLRGRMLDISTEHYIKDTEEARKNRDPGVCSFLNGVYSDVMKNGAVYVLCDEINVAKCEYIRETVYDIMHVKPCLESIIFTSPKVTVGCFFDTRTGIIHDIAPVHAWAQGKKIWTAIVWFYQHNYTVIPGTKDDKETRDA